MATVPSMVMLSSPTSPSPLHSLTTYKIKRKPPPRIELSERYPPPDPSDPFLPLSVLRDRFSAAAPSQHQKEDSPVTSLHPLSSPALPPRSRYRPRSQATFHVVTHTDADTESLSFSISKSPNANSKFTFLPPHDDDDYDDEHDDTRSILSTATDSLNRRNNRGDHKQPLGIINPYAVVAGGRLGSGIDTESFSMMGFDLDRCHAISPDPLPPNSPSNEAQALPILSYNSSSIPSRNSSGGAEAAESPRSPTGSTRLARLFNRKDKEASTSKKIPSLDDRDASTSVSVSSASGSSSGFKDGVVVDDAQAQVFTPVREDSALLGDNSLLLSTSSPKQLDAVVHPGQPNTSIPPLKRTRRISGISVASSSAYTSPTSSPTRVGFDRDSSTIGSVGSIGSLAQLAHFHSRAGSGSDLGVSVGGSGSGSGSFRRLISPLASSFSNENENRIIPGPKDGNMGVDADAVAVVEGGDERKDERKEQENKVKAKSGEKDKQKQKAKRKQKRTSLPARNLPTFREVHSESELAPRGWRYFSDVDESMDESQSDFYDVGEEDYAGASANLEIWKFRARRYDKNGKKRSTTTTTVTTAATSSKDVTTSVTITPSLDTFSRSSPSSSSGSSSSGFSASASSSGSSSGSSYISTPNSTPRSSTSTSTSASFSQTHSSYHSFKSSTTSSYPEPAIPPGLTRADPPRILSISVPHSPTHLELEPESEAESTAKPSISASTSTPTSPTSPWSGRRIFSDSAVPAFARYLSSEDLTSHGARTGDVAASSSLRAGEGGKRHSESKFKLGVKKILKALKRENEVKESVYHGSSGQGQLSSITKVEESSSLSSVHLEKRQSDTVRGESYNNSDVILANAIDNNDNVPTSSFPLSSLHAAGTSAQRRRPSVSSSSISAGSAIAVDLHMKKDDHVDHLDSYSGPGQGDETLVQDDVAKGADTDKALPLAGVRLNDGGRNDDDNDNEEIDMIIVDEGNAWERCGPSRMSTIESEVEFDAEQPEKHQSQTPTPEDIEEDARWFHYHYRSLSSRRRGVLDRRVALDDVFA